MKESPVNQATSKCICAYLYYHALFKVTPLMCTFKISTHFWNRIWNSLPHFQK